MFDRSENFSLLSPCSGSRIGVSWKFKYIKCLLFGQMYIPSLSVPRLDTANTKSCSVNINKRQSLATIHIPAGCRRICSCFSPPPPPFTNFTADENIPGSIKDLGVCGGGGGKCVFRQTCTLHRTVWWVTRFLYKINTHRHTHTHTHTKRERRQLARTQGKRWTDRRQATRILNQVREEKIISVGWSRTGFFTLAKRSFRTSQNKRVQINSRILKDILEAENFASLPPYSNSYLISSTWWNELGRCTADVCAGLNWALKLKLL